jgi:hypothetical protein
MKVEVKFQLNGSDILHSEEVEVEYHKVYTFSKAQEQVMHHLNVKYAWSMEDVTFLSLTLHIE